MNQKPRTTLRQPPHNDEAERYVLGGILIDKNAILKVLDTLEDRDFYNPKHEIIFRHISQLFEKREPIDILSLQNKLKEKELLADVGGTSYLAELAGTVTTASDIEFWANKIKECRILRDLIHASGEITEGALNTGLEFEDLIDDAQSKLMGLIQKSVKKSFVSLKEELTTAFDRIAKMNTEGGIRGVPTGFTKLDNLLSGLQKSDLVVLGARPSLGKTSLALDIARHAAIKGKVSVGIFSLEMSREQVVDRLISSASNVPLWKLRTGRIKEDSDFNRIQKALDDLSGVNIFIDDTPSPNIMQMRAMGRRLQMEQGLDLLIVDYLQLIAPRRSSDNMVSQVTEISRGLKGLARELNVPVLALSQLSRSVDQRDDKTPKLHDLRESGSIEQDADVVLFISRERQTEGQNQNMAQIIIAKHRNGPLGTVDVVFDADKATFRNVDTMHSEGFPGGHTDAEAVFSAM